MSDPEIRCYATRRLNPFHGTVQIVNSGPARAISRDGVNWRIQIRSEIYKTPWSSLAIPEQQDHYFVYGGWSQQQGLARVPIHPSLYAEHVQQAVDELLQELGRVSRRLPFTLQDSRELWLMDADGEQAIALLASQLPDEAIPTQRQVHWSAMGDAEMPFTSTSFATKQAMVSFKARPQDLLNHLIKQRCKPPLRGLWLERQADGSGIVLHDHAGKPVRRNEAIAAEAFPVCLLDETWPDAEATQMVRDYLNWQAPLLLMLPLPARRRHELEQQAQRRPLVVHQFHRLYPAVSDEALLKKILVEAVLRKASEKS